MLHAFHGWKRKPLNGRSSMQRGDCLTCKQEGLSSFPDPERDGEMVLVQQDRKPGTKRSYLGETGRSIQIRGALAKLGVNKDNSFIKYTLEYHNTKAVEDVKFKLTLVDTFEKPMEREVCEGVMIRRGEAEIDLVLNSKLDHYAPVVGRMVMSNSVREGRKGGESRRGVAGRSQGT